MPDDALKNLDEKVSALLAIVLDAYLRQTGVARPKARSIDKMLRDAGLSSATIATLLGKTERAVALQLQTKPSKATKKSKA